MGVCDLTRKDSLYALNEWIPSALEIAGDVPGYLIVNKRDLEERRAISEEEVRHVAEAFAAPIVYTSARTGTLVDDAFTRWRSRWSTARSDRMRPGPWNGASGTRSC